LPRYRVIATQPDGTRTTTECEAATADEAAAGLAREGLSVVRVVEADDGPSLTMLSHDDAGHFAQHLAGLAQAGLLLPEGLRALGEELPAGNLRRLLNAVATRLEQGEALGDALREVGDRFPGHLRSLILAGARSGRIETVLGEYVNYSQVGVSLRRSLWLSLAYPVLMLLVFGVIFTFLSFVVVRGFEAIFADFGVSLPILTVALIRLSRVVTDAGWSILLAPVVAITSVLVAGRILLDPASRVQMIAYVPLFGPLIRWTGLAEFCHYLALLVECELPLGPSVVLAAEGARDGLLVRACQGIARELDAGHSLAESVSWVRIFPAGFRKMLGWAEGHQSLPETLHMIADLFEARARAHSAFIGSVCGIVSIIIIFWGCSFVVVGLFLPLITLISKLSG
jgi:type II secretory pathway component PulF